MSCGVRNGLWGWSKTAPSSVGSLRFVWWRNCENYATLTRTRLCSAMGTTVLASARRFRSPCLWPRVFIRPMQTVNIYELLYFRHNVSHSSCWWTNSCKYEIVCRGMQFGCLCLSSGDYVRHIIDALFFVACGSWCCFADVLCNVIYVFIVCLPYAITRWYGTNVHTHCRWQIFR
jgi:hypothetical protein